MDYRNTREANLLNTVAAAGERLVQLRGFGDFAVASSARADLLTYLRSNADTLKYAAEELAKIWKAEGGDDGTLQGESRGGRRGDDGG